MENNFYNSNDEKYKELISDLKSLPKVDAPDNFEFELMMKIQNGNFGEEKTTPYNFYYKLLLPSSAFAAVAVILFFIFNVDSQLDENLLMKKPPLISEVEAVSSQNGRNGMFEAVENGYKAVLGTNDVVTRKRVDFPFDKSKSIALDNFVGAPSGALQNNSGNVYQVGGTQSGRNFEGFHYIGSVKQNDLIKLKARRDSILNLKRNK